jgi:uncharacterized membrane-anchored protein
MKVEHMPNLGVRYWCALILASIFGANTGDFLSDVLGLGHLAGLPVLAALLGLVFLLERHDRKPHHAYFWAAIIVIRSAATNIGDMGHDLHLSPWVAAMTLASVLILTLLVWAGVHRAKDPGQPGPGSLSAMPLYWWAMLVAGALGTVLGDFCSYDLGLGNLGAALALGALLVCLFAWGRNGRLAALGLYWLTVVVIRSAGTAAGDLLAHGVFGLPLSTLVSGLAFVALLNTWRAPAEGLASGSTETA